MFAIQRVNFILYCQDWQATVRFYRDTLGCPVQFANDWFIEFQLAQNASLSIADETRATIKSGQGSGVTVSLQVTDIEVARQQLQARGVESTAIEEKWGAYVLYFHDPEGHRLEFWQAIAKR